VRAALLVALLVACGRSDPPPRPLDPRAILARHAPHGERIVAGYEALPDRFAGRGPAFADFVDGGPAEVVDDLTTAVHELYHAYSLVLALERGVRGRAVVVDGEPLLVPSTETFPASELDATFPPAARTRRYRIYVSPSQPSQSTQIDGVYGLLDELVAYYHGARTLLELWPWLRDEADATGAQLADYAARLDTAGVALAELRLFVLHYVRHAEAAHPEVHAALIASQPFRRAFADAVAAYQGVVERAAALRPAVFERSSRRGAEAPIGAREPGFAEVERALDDQAYRAVQAALRPD
jgi:hypothetical protein